MAASRRMNLAASSASSKKELGPSLESLLANEIRQAKEECESSITIEQRAQYIKGKIESMDETQLTRFEFYIRSHLSRSKVKEIMQECFGNQATVTDEMAIVVGGLAKLYAGELCDTAIDVLQEDEPRVSSGIEPRHIREAHRRMQRDGKIGHQQDSKFSLDQKSIHSLPSSYSFGIDD